MVMIRRRLRVHGIVQGVGFRPAMHRHAREHGVAGLIGNDGLGVFLEVEGPETDVTSFIDALDAAAPPLAVIDRVDVTEVVTTGDDRFRIVESDASAPAATLVAPDVGPCDDCLTELADPADRRFRYPFLNCTNCGPRYSIVRSLPYDRATTTMAGFVMCHRCDAEYHDPDDRRFHAQPTCCPACGPTLVLHDGDRALDVDDVVDAVVERLRAGEVVAAKGLGGFHLIVDARNEHAVARLRTRKHREDKPFAVLVRDVAAARSLARVDALEADLLLGPARPIVLLGRRDDADVADAVAPANRSLGLLLPPTPLHVLLSDEFAGPLVLTSGNRSSEPIAVDDATAFDRLEGIADVFCTHDRPIHVRVDDSVTRVVGDRQIVVRRARGLAPRPVRVPGGVHRHTLACGAQLKSTICVARDDIAVVSEHLGDLEHPDAFAAFQRAARHLQALFAVEPRVVVHDLHPDFQSTTHAIEYADSVGAELVGVQHHHAHIASCLADNEADGAVIGVAFDGLGLGPDGTVWGGEFLHADRSTFSRLGHLATVPMPGGEAAVREPWRMAAVHLAEALGRARADRSAVAARNRQMWDAVLSVAAGGTNAPATSSMGRLFDAVSSVLGVRDRVTYEGQAAIELEQLVDRVDHPYPFEIDGDEVFSVDVRKTISAVVDDVRSGLSPARIAGRFHATVVEIVLAGVDRIRSRTGLRRVALSGGVFQNSLLVSAVSDRLSAAGMDVLTHRRFPANDGGISLGQAVVVAARDSAALDGSSV